MAKIVMVAFGFSLVSPLTARFSDVPVGSVFFRYVETAAQEGIVGGYRDGTFRPNDNVTRGQLSKITVSAGVRQLGWTLLDSRTIRFSDVPVGSAFFRYVETAVCHQMVSGYSDGTFHPGDAATRGQIAKIVCLAVRNEGPCRP